MNTEVVCLIINESYTTRILKKAQELGIPEATIFNAQGTVRSSLMHFLGLDEVRREVVLLITDTEKSKKAIQELDDKFHFDKPNHGIAFTLSVSQLLGMTNIDTVQARTIERGENKGMYQAIFVIVDRGDSEDVLEAAKTAGSRGGTIIHARGTGSEEAESFFQMDIDPEKDVVLILSQVEKADQIVDAIHEKLDLDQPNKGILFKLDVNETRGLAK